MGNQEKEKIRKDLRREDVTAIIDTREQTPLTLDPLITTRKALRTGDYSALGYEDQIAYERKSLSDLVGCVGQSRDRFEDCLERLSAYKFKAIVVESDWSKIDLKQYRGTLTPSQIIGTIMSWAIGYNVSIMFAGDHQRAGIFMARLIYIAANRCHRSANGSSLGS